MTQFTINNVYHDTTPTVKSSNAEEIINYVDNIDTFKLTASNSIQLYQHQKDLLELIENEDLLSVKHSRQVGVSTALLVYLMWKLEKGCDETIAFIASSHIQCDSILKSFQQFLYLNSDVSFSQSVNSNTIHNKNNNCTITFLSTSYRSMGTSRTFDHVILDKHPYTAKEFSGCLHNMHLAHKHKPTKITEFSTPAESTLLNNPYSCYIPWTIVPGRDENFKNSVIAIIGDDQWKIEYGN